MKIQFKDLDLILNRQRKNTYFSTQAPTVQYEPGSEKRTSNAVIKKVSINGSLHNPCRMS